LSCETKPLVLVVDDEESILEAVAFNLTHEGYRADTSTNGEEAIRLFEATKPDLVILDYMLPDRSGVEVCRAMRALADVPVLFLTARDQLEDKVQAFESGADDFLCKPFKFKELMVRLRSLLRRAGARDRGLVSGDIHMEPSARRVSYRGQPVALTLREYELLEMMMKRPNSVISREELLSTLWGWDLSIVTNVIEVHISSLRAKLGDGAHEIIRTIRGVGYSLG
jgi:two-component system OmpR family response regulator